MLTDLIVSELGVIEQAEVEFSAGSTALTGETGAGKTLVVAALGLLLGERADRSLVRTGAKAARVEGRWVLPSSHPVVQVLANHDLIGQQPEGSVEVVASRTVDAAGAQSKARINSRMVPIRLLDEVCGGLVEITGQHLHQRIVRPGWQRSLLDRLAGDEAVDLAERVATLVAEARDLERRAEEASASARSRAREIDLARYEIGEMRAAALQPGEAENLSVTVSRLEAAEALAIGLEGGARSLEGEGGAIGKVLAAEESVAGVVASDPGLQEIASRLEAARHELADLATEMRGRIIEPDEESLEAARQRLSEISRLLRKYGPSEEAALEHLAVAEETLARLESDDEEGSAAVEAAAARWSEARRAAARLSELRSAAAHKLARAVEARLHDLAMQDARFKVELEAHELTEGGLERPIFMFSANPGEAPRPLAKVASGGEISRTALALRLVEREVGANDDWVCMVFDEVDAGVGGAAARNVGRCLAELGSGSRRQVLVITHLPQVAAFADHHLKVAKGTDGTVTRAVVTRLEGDARVDEVSRMLAGTPESTVSRRHAKELLAEVAR